MNLDAWLNKMEVRSDSMKQAKGLLYFLIALGLIMFAIGAAYPIAILVIDTSPPVFVDTVPKNGETYTSLTELAVSMQDLESGVQSVQCSIDSGPVQNLALVSGDRYSGSWKVSYSLTTSGTHTFSFTAKNYAGLTSTISGSFTIYTEFAGKWYINDIEITSPTQVVYVTSPTVNFKFVKVAGIEDEKITCTVSWSGPYTGSISLPLTSPGTWEGSNTFSKEGQYNVELKAFDGTTTITMSLFALQVGQVSAPIIGPSVLQYSLMGFGLLLIVVPAAMLMKKR